MLLLYNISEWVININIIKTILKWIMICSPILMLYGVVILFIKKDFNIALIGYGIFIVSLSLLGLFDRYGGNDE